MATHVQLARFSASGTAPNKLNAPYLAGFLGDLAGAKLLPTQLPTGSVSQVAASATLTADQRAFADAVSRGVEAAYALAKKLATKPGVKGGGLETDDPTLQGHRNLLRDQLGHVINTLHRAYGEAKIPGGGSPFELKLPFRLYNFLYQNQGEGGVYDSMLEKLSTMPGMLTVIQDSQYDSMLSAAASTYSPKSSLGAVQAVVIGVVAIALAVIAWRVSDGVKADAEKTKTYAQTIEGIMARCQTLNCSPDQLAELLKSGGAVAPSATDWVKVAKYAMIGIGILAGLVLFTTLLPEIKVATSPIRALRR